MPTTTSNQGLTIPVGSDVNGVPAAFVAYNTGVESRLVQRFLSGADRTVRNPTPVAGELSYLASTDTFERYNGLTWTPIPGQVISRGSRSTNSSTTTTVEIPVLRVDGIPVISGRAYVIRVNNFGLNTTVNGDAVIARLRYSNAGLATVASTELTALRINIASTAAAPILPINANWWAVATETLSILLTVQRAGGTGNVSLSPTAGQTIDIVVQDAGTDPGDTGVDL